MIHGEVEGWEHEEVGHPEGVVPREDVEDEEWVPQPEGGGGPVGDGGAVEEGVAHHGGQTGVEGDHETDGGRHSQ